MWIVSLINTVQAYSGSIYFLEKRKRQKEEWIKWIVREVEGGIFQKTKSKWRNKTVMLDLKAEIRLTNRREENIFARTKRSLMQKTDGKFHLEG